MMKGQGVLVQLIEFDVQLTTGQGLDGNVVDPLDIVVDGFFIQNYLLILGIESALGRLEDSLHLAIVCIGKGIFLRNEDVEIPPHCLNTEDQLSLLPQLRKGKFEVLHFLSGQMDVDQMPRSNESVLIVFVEREIIVGPVVFFTLDPNDEVANSAGELLVVLALEFMRNDFLLMLVLNLQNLRAVQSLFGDFTIGIPTLLHEKVCVSRHHVHVDGETNAFALEDFEEVDVVVYFFCLHETSLNHSMFQNTF